jgi:hypothetical protein
MHSGIGADAHTAANGKAAAMKLGKSPHNGKRKPRWLFRIDPVMPAGHEIL